MSKGEVPSAAGTCGEKLLGPEPSRRGKVRLFSFAAEVCNVKQLAFPPFPHFFQLEETKENSIGQKASSAPTCNCLRQNMLETKSDRNDSECIMEFHSGEPKHCIITHTSGSTEHTHEPANALFITVRLSDIYFFQSDRARPEQWTL